MIQGSRTASESYDCNLLHEPNLGHPGEGPKDASEAEKSSVPSCFFMGVPSKDLNQVIYNRPAMQAAAKLVRANRNPRYAQVCVTTALVMY